MRYIEKEITTFEPKEMHPHLGCKGKFVIQNDCQSLERTGVTAPAVNPLNLQLRNLAVGRCGDKYVAINIMYS